MRKPDKQTAPLTQMQVVNMDEKRDENGISTAAYSGKRRRINLLEEIGRQINSINH